MAQSLAEGIDDEFRKQRILANVDKLKTLQPELATVTQQALKDKPGARNKLDQVIEKMRTVNYDLNICAATTTEEEMMERASLIDRSLKDLKARGDPDPFQFKGAITSQIGELLSQVKPQVAMATSLAATLSDDPELALMLRSQSQELDLASSKLQADAATLLSGPTSGAKFQENKARFLDDIDLVSKCNDLLVSVSLSAADDQMEVLQGRLLADLKHVKQGVSDKDVRGTARALADANRDGKDMSYLAKLIATEVDDPHLKQCLEEAASLLSVKLGGLVNPAKAAAKDPKQKQHLDDYIVGLESTINSLVTLSSNVGPEDKMIQNADVINKIDKRFVQDIEKGQSAKAATAFMEQQKKVKKQQKLASIVADRCNFDKNLGEELVTETNKLEVLLDEVEKRSEAAKRNPNDAKALKAFKDITDEFQKQTALTGKLAQNVKAARKEAEIRAKEEAIKAEEEARRLNEERKMKAAAAVPIGIKEIWMDAQDLLETTQAIDIDNSPIGQLVHLAEDLAKLMQQLASLSKTGTKTDIIMLARKVADTITNIHNHIGQVCAGCRDRVLNGDLTAQGNVSKNCAVQLKILCGVKANLVLEDDPDTRQSLVICARGLCKSVNEIVNLSQVAKLKPVKN